MNTASAAFVRGRDRTPDSLTDPACWDGALCALDGHLLQSRRWGEFKSRHGWKTERIAVAGPDGDPAAMAQLLFRRGGPVSVGYVPRGPAFRSGGVEALGELFDQVDRVCRAQRALYLIVESDRSLPFKGRFRQFGFVRGPDHIQPSRTVKVPLVDDDRLLAQMHQKTRYSVRLEQRRGVVVERGTTAESDLDDFYSLLRDTSHRNEFDIHDGSYYADFLRIFNEDAILLFATVDGVRAASLIAAKFGREAIYMYGGSSSAHRAHGAAFFLQFEAMRWAREAGCLRYDLWGIPSEDPASTGEAGERVAGTRGADWRGLYKFKIGFGGEIVTYPVTLERRYHPVLAFVARHAYAPRG
jgi:lipid II:glycine glycyltransferase (peptidoglycan interpeptide bridge formation enzyme)